MMRKKTTVEAIKELEKVEGFMFPNSELGEPVTKWEDTFSGFDMLVEKSLTDNVNHPKHYTTHPSGVEAIEITRWLRGPYSNACKYVMRGWEGLKGDPIEDLEKALWYLNDAEKFPDDGRGIPDHAQERLALWSRYERDENKTLVVTSIVNGNTWERYDIERNGFIEYAKNMLKERIAYLQSRPDVAL